MTTSNQPRPEYPRPDFVREQWQCLNGEWEFAFDDEDKGLEERWYEGQTLDRRITVPFCYQSEASGIGAGYEKHEILWYARRVCIPAEYSGKRLLLHFGAVDYRAQVWVDGRFAGEHTGGYTPFSLDITHLAAAGGECRVMVRVEDYYRTTQPRGKQNWEDKPFGCWYTPTSGIWQSVWMEPVEEVYLRRVRITPDIDRRTASLECYFNKEAGPGALKLEVSFQGTLRVTTTVSVGGSRIVKATIDMQEPDMVDEIHYWTPEKPELYDLRMTLQQENGNDVVGAYFGMRKIEVDRGRIRLNNRPLFQRLLLDQGYWTDTLLTPPSDEAIKEDIRLAKEMGFNGLRKHQKVEDPRFYYWADKLGMLVWGEVPSAYEFCTEEMENLVQTTKEFIERDYNHPCIICWVPLNESWGVRNICTDKEQQQFARGLYHLAKMLDNTRLVSGNDGWEQVETDICAVHDYVAYTAQMTDEYRDIATMHSANNHRMLYADGSAFGGEPVLITEYGGIAFAKDGGGDNWGYNGMVSTEAEYLERLEDITRGFCSLPYVQGFCYTQITDVFQEVNGLLGMDRKPKVPMEEIRRIIAG